MKNILRACCCCEAKLTAVNNTKHRYCRECWQLRMNFPETDLTYLCEHVDREFNAFTDGAL